MEVSAGLFKENEQRMLGHGGSLSPHQSPPSTSHTLTGCVSNLATQPDLLPTLIEYYNEPLHIIALILKVCV